MGDVKYEKRDRIGYITLNRPEALNALDDKINGELWEIWKASRPTILSMWRS